MNAKEFMRQITEQRLRLSTGLNLKPTEIEGLMEAYARHFIKERVEIAIKEIEEHRHHYTDEPHPIHYIYGAEDLRDCLLKCTE